MEDNTNSAANMTIDQLEELLGVRKENGEIVRPSEKGKWRPSYFYRFPGDPSSVMFEIHNRSEALSLIEQGKVIEVGR